MFRQQFVHDATKVFEQSFVRAKNREGPLADEVLKRIDLVSVAVGQPFDVVMQYHFNRCHNRVLQRPYWADLDFPKEYRDFYSRMFLGGVNPDYFLISSQFKEVLDEVRSENSNKEINVEMERRQVRSIFR